MTDRLLRTLWLICTLLPTVPGASAQTASPADLDRRAEQGQFGGAKTYRQSGRASANNPFAKTSVFREHTPSYVCFEINGDTCTMRAYDLQGKVIDEKTFAARPTN